jgi:hypothetical protein
MVYEVRRLRERTPWMWPNRRALGVLGLLIAGLFGPPTACAEPSTGATGRSFSGTTR